MSHNIRLISNITAALVALLAIGSLALSYNALQAVALANGITGWQSYLWPLLIDASLVVFSLAVVRNALRAERTAWPWLLVGIYTGATVIFNLLHAPGHLAGWGVAIVAPVSLFLSFETLMGHLKSDVRRGAVVQGINTLKTEEKRLEAIVARLESQKSKLSGEVKELRKNTYAGISEETRAAALDVLRNAPDITGADLGRELGKSASTGRRLRRELLPVVNGNGHGGAG